MIQIPDLALLFHLIDHLVSVLGPLFRAPTLALNDFFRAGVTLVREIVEDPVVEVPAPMEEGVGRCGVCFAESKGRLAKGVWEGYWRRFHVPADEILLVDWRKRLAISVQTHGVVVLVVLVIR